ncbi:ABC transporter permease [Paenibacillus lautus]|uniref:ABC transporter permease n=1 Tax=Paenibacillus lautus TaxID=1401 RepID=UPI002DBD5DF0|nr:ABC transporter permease [Paenibacillus lautus]MEC0309903.1 ABC transporter permease [Paenibacillus lautus]
MDRSYHFSHPGALFWRRVTAHWKNQRDNLATVVDWIVMLYIIVPGLLLGGGLYRELWTSPLPGWSQFFPLQAVAGILLFMFSGRVLLFLEEADVLFLRQQRGWMKGLMIRGMAYSHTVSAIKGLVVTVLVLPILVREHEITGIALVTLLVITAVCAWCANLSTAMIRSSYKGWRKYVMTYLVRWLSFGLLALLVTFWLESYMVLWAAALILLMVLLLLSRKRLAMQGTFIADAREDAKTRVQLTEKLLVQAVGKPPSVRSKTWFMRKSGRLFKGTPEKRLADAGLKAILRHPESLLLYIQITLVGIPAVWLPPPIIKIIVYLALVLMMSYWLNTRWAVFAKAEFMQVLPFTNQQHRSAGVLAVRTLLALPAFLYSLVAGLTLLQGTMGWIAVLALTVLAVMIAPSLMSWPVYKEERHPQE